MRKAFVSLFTGAGGLDQGFIDAGWEPLLMVDSWKPAIDTLAANHCAEIVQADLAAANGTLLTARIDAADVLCVVGGPPCQAFSRLNQNQLFAGGLETETNLNDPRRSLFMDFLRIVRCLMPPFVVMENVADLKTRKLGGAGSDRNRRILKVILEEFDIAGYTVVAEVLRAQDFNVPQMRKRIIFIGVRKDLRIAPSVPTRWGLGTSVAAEFMKIRPEHPNQDRKAHSAAWINKVGHIPQGGYYNHLPLEHKVLKPFLYAAPMSEVDNRTHTATIRPGYCLRTPDGRYHQGDVPLELVDCGGTFFQVMPRMGTYLRRIQETVSHTVTRNPLIHPTENREITVREKAAIQTFPPEYRFVGTIQEQHVLVGNAVPCNLGKSVATHLGVLCERRRL